MLVVHSVSLTHPVVSHSTCSAVNAKQVGNPALDTVETSSLKKLASGAPQTPDLRHVQIDTTKVDQARTSSVMNGRSESLKSILKASLGLEAQEFRTGSSMSHKTEKRLSSVTLEILMEREEIDIHPYGRGGIYEGILYKRKEDETPNVLELFVWFIIFGSLVMMSVIIVFIAGK
ncbi:hypothetical protein PHET_05567 [Paragonimus heterotremus]|uniref:Uncharacterized protein n=1 Tax=Paragonimus heterotremus TaxID=100268 RepID=A0A8J4SNF4_9TREM|nr:hypothetical protein PHET_05567 [Paragonimus heterotremus]